MDALLAGLGQHGRYPPDRNRNTIGHVMSETKLPANGQAATVKKLFSRSTSVAIDIAAPPDTIWALLTDVDSFKSLNSTIVPLTPPAPSPRNGARGRKSQGFRLISRELEF
jgi:hypothetical protein